MYFCLSLREDIDSRELSSEDAEGCGNLCTGRGRRGEDIEKCFACWVTGEYRFVVARYKEVDTMVCFMDIGGEWLAVYGFFCSSGLPSFCMDLAVVKRADNKQP